MNLNLEKRLTYAGITLFFIVMSIIALISNGTGDDGDSVSHFIYSRDAFKHPKYFFVHWAKPLFVLLSAPFAQFDFVGIKLMNVGIITLTMILTYQLAQRWRIPHAWLAPLFIAAMPRIITHTLSGLTEPMFVLFLTTCVVLYQRKNYFWATVLVSFLPFVRSEGLIIFCVLVVYLAVLRLWKYIPLLAVGHAVYALAGYSTHKSLLWVFNTMSYGTLDHVYGVGKWYDFILNMPWVTGGFGYFMLIVGLIAGLVRLINFLRKRATFDVDELWLSYGIFVAYFIAHSLFWTFGVFASQGLMRVMICVGSMMGLISARGAGFITEGVSSLFPKLRPHYVRSVIVALSVIFLFRNLTWRIDFNLHPSQLTQFEAAKKYKDKIQKEGYALYTESMYVNLAFGVNPMDDSLARGIYQVVKREPVPEKSLLVWEYIWAAGMSGIPFELIAHDKQFKLIDEFTHEDFIWGGTFRTLIFEADSNYIRQIKKNQPLYLNNFETGDYINKTRAKQNTLGIKLDAKTQFAPGLDGSVASYFTKPEQKFKVSFDVFLEELNNHPVVVFQTISAKGETVDWQKFDPTDQIKVSNQWIHVEVVGVARKVGDIHDTFKIYAWGPNKVPCYIDNFQVENVE